MDSETERIKVKVLWLSETRYYVGKFKVEVLLKGKGFWKAMAIEKIVKKDGQIILPAMVFDANPRTLWRHPRKVVKRDLEVEK